MVSPVLNCLCRMFILKIKIRLNNTVILWQELKHVNIVDGNQPDIEMYHLLMPPVALRSQYP